MKRALLAAAVCGSLFASTAGLVGCKDDRGGAGGGSTKADGTANSVAVVNLDEVAKGLGWLTKMEADLTTYQTQLRDKLKEYDASYASEVKTYISTIVPKDAKPDDKIPLTPQQQQLLTNMVTAARQQVQGLAQKGDQQFAQYRAQWIKQYRDALEPIVRQVAQEKKMTVVLVQTDAVLYAEPTVNLTNAVVDAAKAHMPSLTDIVKPPLVGSPNIDVQMTPPIGPTSQSTTKPAK